MDATHQAILKRVLFITLCSIAASVAITHLCFYVAQGSEVWAHWRLVTAIAIIAPGLIAPVASYHTESLNKRLQASNQRLKQLSETDPLTETLNRRRFMEVADQQLALAQRYCYPTSLLLLDIDHFKQVNDLYGHAMGDRALVQLTRVMAAELRETDTMARFGGEEFIMLLPHTAREGALSLAERVRTAARHHIIKHQESETSVTISIGGVTCESSTTPLDRMISHADKLLYDSKQAGRDRCSIEAISGQSPMPVLHRQVS